MAPEVIVIYDSDDEKPTATSTKTGTKAIRPLPSSLGGQDLPPHLNEPSLASSAAQATTSEHATGQAAAPVLDRAGLSALATGGLSRAQMEQERLERQRKRQRALESHGAAASSSSGGGAAIAAPASKKPRMGTLATLERESGAPRHGPAVSPPELGASGRKDTQHFWKGELRPTYNRHYPDDPTAVRAEDIVGPRGLVEMAMLCSFCAEPEWVHSLFNSQTPLLLVKHDPVPGVFVSNQEDAKNMYLLHPKIGRYGSMHIKFFIIYYPAFCRIAIPTANAISYDWDIIQNSVWVQDFPRRPQTSASAAASPASSTSSPSGLLFYSTLLDVLARLGVPERFVSSLDSYCFDNCTARLVPSIASLTGGWSLSPNRTLEAASHAGKSEARLQRERLGKDARKRGYGLFRLAREVAEAGWACGPGTGRTVELECQGSSTGNYKADWMRDFHRACSGHLPSAAFPDAPSADPTFATFTTPRSTLTWSIAPASPPWAGLPPPYAGPVIFGGDRNWPPVKVLFPSLATVKDSHEGPAGGGTMFTQGKVWNATGFPKWLFGDAKSRKAKVLMHVKMVLATFVEEVWEPKARQKGTCARDDAAAGWLYVGSHNFTPAAWGRMKGGNGERVTLDLSNYELGVLLPVPKHGGDDMITWQRPVQAYLQSTDADGRQPWMQFSYSAGSQQ